MEYEDHACHSWLVNCLPEVRALSQVARTSVSSATSSNWLQPFPVFYWNTFKRVRICCRGSDTSILILSTYKDELCLHLTSTVQSVRRLLTWPFCVRIVINYLSVFTFLNITFHIVMNAALFFSAVEEYGDKFNGKDQPSCCEQRSITETVINGSMKETVSLTVDAKTETAVFKRFVETYVIWKKKTTSNSVFL